MPYHHYCKYHARALKPEALVQKLYIVTGEDFNIHREMRHGPREAKIDRLQREDNLIQSVVSDGGMEVVGYFDGRQIINNTSYSMNKRKRWELPEMLENAIANEAFEDSDFVQKELRSSPSVRDTENEDENTDEYASPYHQARSKDLGILYHFSVTNRMFQRKCETCAEERGRTAAYQRKTSRYLSEDIAEAISSRHTSWVHDCCWEEEEEKESAPSHEFKVNIADLLDNIPLKHKAHRRRREATGCSDFSDDALVDRHIVISENTQVANNVPIAASRKSLPRAPFVASDSRRTFFFPRINLTDVDAVVSMAAALVTPDPLYRVAFFDVGHAFAVVAVFRATISGVECSVKAPELFLERMPEFMCLDELLDRFERVRKREAHLTGRKESCLYEKAKDTFSPSHHSVSMYNLTVGSLLRSDEGPIALGDGECFLCGNSGVIVNSCGHSACDFCWLHYMTAKVSDGITRFTCMENDCKSLISADLIGFLGPWGILEPWQSRNLDTVISSANGFQCPTQRCHHAVLVESECDKPSLARSLVLCSGCLKGLCLLCKENWHWPCPCTEAETYHNVVMASKKDDTLNRNGRVRLRYTASTKKCPGCKLIMEKGEGCNHMRCNCGMQFCWFCGQPQKKHYGPGGTYRGCAEEQPLDKTDVGQTKWKDLRSKDAVHIYQRSVELRKKRFRLRKNKTLDEDVKVALFISYNILEYGFAYESQMAGAGLRLSNRIKSEMDNFRFVLGLLEDHVADGQGAKAKIYAEKVMSSLVKLWGAFQSNEKY